MPPPHRPGKDSPTCLAARSPLFVSERIPMAASDLAGMIRVIREPTVYLVGRQTVDDAALDRFLSDHGVAWQTDTEVAAEHLAEVAGRVCFDEETEVLTDEGWKRFAELNRQERVLTLNPQTLQVEFQQPDAYQVYDYD